MPYFTRREGSANGAGILGLHLEGPFISSEKRGAHPEHCVATLTGGSEQVRRHFFDLDKVSIVTLAPELDKSSQIVSELCNRGVVVSLGKYPPPLLLVSPFTLFVRKMRSMINCNT